MKGSLKSRLRQKREDGNNAQSAKKTVPVPSGIGFTRQYLCRAEEV